MRLEMVDGETPFLLSNACLKATAADVYSTEFVLYFRDLGIMVPLKVNQKGLFTVELSGVLHAISSNSVNHVCAKQCEVVTTAISDEQLGLGVGKTE